MTDDAAPVLSETRPTTVARHRPLVPVLIGFSAGIALDGLGAAPIGVWTVACAASVILVVLGLRRGLPDRARWALAMLMLVPFGGFWHAARFRATPANHLKNLNLPADSLWHLRARVRERPAMHYRWDPFAESAQGTAGYWMLRVEAEALSSDEEQWHPTAGGLAVFGDGPAPAVEAGDRVQFLGRIGPNRRPTNPGERDRALGYERFGSYGTASVASADSLRMLSSPSWWRALTAAPSRFSGRLSAGVARILERSGSVDAAGLVQAVLFGRPEKLTPATAELFAESGTLHFLAVSGLHVGLFCLLAGGLLTIIGVPVRMRLILTIAAVWGYVAFTGIHTSAARAGWMLTFMLAAPLFGRRGDPLSGLAAAALAILLLQPQRLFSSGFQLTFVAVWAILCIYPQLAGILWPWEDLVARLRHPEEAGVLSEVGLWARSYLLMSFTVWAATAPLIAYHFHLFSPLTPLLNLVMWPLVLSLLVTCLALALSVALGGILAGVLAALALFWAEGMRSLLQATEGLPGFGLYVPSPPAWWVALFFGGLALWVFRWRPWAGRRSAVAVAAVLGVAFVAFGAGPDRADAFTLTIADVGHGHAVLAETREGHGLLIDAGSTSPSARNALADLLWHRGVPRVDAAVLSHFNRDHYSFLPFVHRRFTIDQLILPARADFSGVAELVSGRLRRMVGAPRYYREGDSIGGGDLRCDVIHPSLDFLARPDLSENDQSLVLMCSYRGLRVLLPGDSEGSALRRLNTDFGGRLRAQVLVLPHHGHYHAGLGEFIANVSPRVAVASGDADECELQTRALLDDHGVELWVTGEDGAVTVRYDGKSVRVSGHASSRSIEFALSGTSATQTP